MIIKFLLFFFLLIPSAYCEWDNTAGSSTDINVGSNANIAGLNRNFTVWVRYKTGADVTGPYAFVSQGTGGFVFRINSSKINFLESGVADIFSGATILLASTNYTSAITVDSNATANLILYLNGVSDATSTTTRTFGDSGQPFRIGADANGANSSFKGVIREICIWNTVLTANELVTLHNMKLKRGALMIEPKSLVSYWSLDDLSDGTALIDGVSFGKDFVNTNNGTIHTSAGNARASLLCSYP